MRVTRRGLLKFLGLAGLVGSVGGAGSLAWASNRPRGMEVHIQRPRKGQVVSFTAPGDMSPKVVAVRPASALVEVSPEFVPAGGLVRVRVVDPRGAREVIVRMEV